MKYILLLAPLMTTHICSAQSMEQRLAKAMNALLHDAQLKHAITGFEVVDSKTGKLVYAYNEQVGLAPASTQKIFTSIATFDLLGSDYRYKTSFGYTGTIKDTVLIGNL